MTLTIERLSHSYGQHEILHSISLSVHPGEIFGILGPNGAGKSTLIHLISGVLRPARGSVSLSGRSLHTLPASELARNVAVLEQDPQVSVGFTVRQLVELGRFPYLTLFSRTTAEDREAVAHALDACRIESLADRPVHSLSGGERRRAFLALTLAQSAPVLLLDEPFAHLDIGHCSHLLRVLLGLQTASKIILLTAHDISMAARLATRLGLLYDAQLRSVGTPAQILTNEALSRAFSVPVCVVGTGDRCAVVPAIEDN